MKMIQQGNGLNMEQVYGEYFPMVYNYVFCRLMHREETEDVVSHVFLKVFRHLDSYDASRASLRTWIFRVTERTLIDYYRKHSRALICDLNENHLDEMMYIHFDTQYEQMLMPTRRTIFHCLHSLTVRERGFVVCKYYMGLTNREIARRMGMNENTVSAVLLRARRKLRGLLEGEGILSHTVS